MHPSSFVIFYTFVRAASVLERLFSERRRRKGQDAWACDSPPSDLPVARQGICLESGGLRRQAAGDVPSDMISCRSGQGQGRETPTKLPAMGRAQAGQTAIGAAAFPGQLQQRGGDSAAAAAGPAAAKGAKTNQIHTPPTQVAAGKEAGPADGPEHWDRPRSVSIQPIFKPSRLRAVPSPLWRRLKRYL